MKYNVLKKFGDFKKGEVLDTEEGFEGTADDLEAAVEAGKLELIEEEVEGAGDSDTEGAGPVPPEEPEPPKHPKGLTKIIFKLRNKNEKSGFSFRTFCEADHGQKFIELADLFEKGNKSKVLDRQSE